jgi:hypothetical protein
MAIRMRSRSKLGKPCCICGSSEQVEMHHVRHIRKMKGKKATGFKAIMNALNRKQIRGMGRNWRKSYGVVNIKTGFWPIFLSSFWFCQRNPDFYLRH